MLVPAAPAQAGSMYLQVCFEVGTTPGGTAVFECCWIEVPAIGPRDPWPPDCPECLPAFDFWKNDIDPVVRGEFNERFGKGFGHLADAALAQDPESAKRLRARAARMFLAAAEIVAKYELSPDGTGWLDAKSGKFYGDPEPEPMVQLGKAIVEAFGMLDKALGDPDPQPSIEAALVRLDEAVARLNELAVS